MPNAVQSCQVMTSAPRILAGAFSAAKTGTVTSLRPIPIPSKIRQATNWPQCCVHADPMGARTLKTAPTRIVPFRPSKLFRGSEIHPALRFPRISTETRPQQVRFHCTHKKAMAMYGQELMNPKIHWLRSALTLTVPSGNVGLLSIPNCCGYDCIIAQG